MSSHSRFAAQATLLSRLLVSTFIAVLVLALCSGLIVHAAAGDLDTSFSTDGKQTTNFFNDFDDATDVVLQSDGKIITAGIAVRSGHPDFAVARYKSDGSLDTTFSGDGKVTTDFAGDDTALAVALQPSTGKIVVAGFSTDRNGQRDFALARYNSNGTLDTTFDRDGRVKTDFFGARDGAFDVAIQNDGKIIAVGRAETTAGSAIYDFALVRYNTNGSLDNTFDGDGKLTTDFYGRSDFATSVSLQSDGKIVVAGGANNTPTGTDFAVARYFSNGTLDATFSGDGKQNTDFGRSGEFGNAVAIQSDGQIVVAGFTYTTATGYRVALARYKTNGGLDTTFSGDGRQITGFTGLNTIGTDVAIQKNGKIVVAGGTNEDIADVLLVRYNTNGSPDTTFSGDGKVLADFGGDDFGEALAIQSDGKIIVAGTTGPGVTSVTKYDFLVARFLGGATPTTAPTDNDKPTGEASGGSNQVSAAPGAPAQKSAARRRLEVLLPYQDPTSESEW